MRWNIISSPKLASAESSPAISVEMAVISVEMALKWRESALKWRDSALKTCVTRARLHRLGVKDVLTIVAIGALPESPGGERGSNANANAPTTTTSHAAAWNRLEKPPWTRHGTPHSAGALLLAPMLPLLALLVSVLPDELTDPQPPVPG